MPTSRCPVVRAQKPPYAYKTTDYHDWTDGSGSCRFCGQVRKDTQVDIVLGERFYESDDAEEFNARWTNLWQNVMCELARLHS